MGYACKLSGISTHNKTYRYKSNKQVDLGKIHQYRYITTDITIYWGRPSSNFSVNFGSNALIAVCNSDETWGYYATWKYNGTNFVWCGGIGGSFRTPTVSGTTVSGGNSSGHQIIYFVICHS